MIIFWYTPKMDACLAFIRQAQESTTGEVELKLGGTCWISTAVIFLENIEGYGPTPTEPCYTEVIGAGVPAVSNVRGGQLAARNDNSKGLNHAGFGGSAMRQSAAVAQSWVRRYAGGQTFLLRTTLERTNQ